MPDINWNTAWKVILIVASFFGAAIPLWLSVLSYITGKRDKRFESYHKLIDDLVGRDDGLPYIDRQVAIIYELKRFKEYYPITLKILTALKSYWRTAAQQNIHILRVLEEIDLTVDHINRKNRSFFSK